MKSESIGTAKLKQFFFTWHDIGQVVNNSYQLIFWVCYMTVTVLSKLYYLLLNFCYFWFCGLAVGRNNSWFIIYCGFCHENFRRAASVCEPGHRGILQGSCPLCHQRHIPGVHTKPHLWKGHGIRSVVSSFCFPFPSLVQNISGRS